MNTTYYTSAPYIVFDIHLIAEIDVGFFRHKDTDNGLYFYAGVSVTGQALKLADLRAPGKILARVEPLASGFSKRNIRMLPCLQEGEPIRMGSACQ